MWPFQVSINVREGIGLGLVFVALVLTPIAWAWSRTLWFVALVLLVLGTLLFFTSRMRDRERELERDVTSGGSHRPAVPTDIHNYTGWRHGGRSETMDRDVSDGDD
jgi:uncharacterized protein (DUF58 family)